MIPSNTPARLMMRHLNLFALACALLAAAPLAAQHGAAPEAPADSTTPPPLYGEVLGSFTWPVTTRSAEAQAYFSQGVKLMYAFALPAARHSFAEARRRDPSCAMCWWGEAWAMGPYLNGAMSDADAPAAHAAAQRARELAAHGTPVEQALAEAMAARYQPSHPAGGRKGLDSAFAAAMAGVHARFPDHLSAAALYADALMVLEPRRGIWPVEKPSVALIHDMLRRGLAADITHPGLCHSYIHATETTPAAGEAQACGDLLVNAMPGASHLNHMPSHTYNRMGRWADAVTSNQHARRSDLAAKENRGISIYPGHNLHMLLFAASMDGQGAVALHAADDYARENPGGVSLHSLALVRFGRWSDVLALTAAPSHQVHRGMWAFARGYAHLRGGQRDSANTYATLVDSLARDTPAGVAFRGHSAANLLGILGGVLKGEMHRLDGRTDDAVAALEAAVVLEDALQYDEPEPLPFAVRDWLGAVLLEASRPADAERVYRAALFDRPHNGWSLFGLEQSLRAQNKSAEADATREQLTAAWARADVPLTASRF